jgi:3-dehydroquinate synthase
VLADEAVSDRWGHVVVDGLETAGLRAVLVEVPSGEQSKSLAMAGEIYRRLAAAGIDRDGMVFTLGGGVVGDLGGFAAATWLRGVRCVQLPTTLLAQVDAAVGGKTGVDLPEGKNLVGAFHQPSAVIADLDTLATLPDREYRAGLAEVVKYGVIDDPALLDLLERETRAALLRDPGVVAEVVERSCRIKARVVGDDERESGRRTTLNYGHTVGHAVEAVTGYEAYLHGEAVSLGMAAAGTLSAARCGFADGDRRRVERLLTALGLPVRLRQALDAAELVERMRRDKKSRDGTLRFVLAERLGAVRVEPVPEPDVHACLAAIAP